MSQPVPIQLNPKRMLCARHGEPLRAEWPSGAAIVMIKLFEQVLETTEVKQRRFEGKLKDDDALGRMLEELLDEKPACCRVEKADMKANYVESGIGYDSKRCSCCKQQALGTSYQTTTQTIDHLCFHCVVYRMESLH